MKINEVTKPLYELTAVDPNAKIYKGSYLSPEQAQHNLELLKQGKVKMDLGDHANAWIQDAANMMTFGFADKAAAGLDSLIHGTKYKDELSKYQKGNKAYQTDPHAANIKIPDWVPLIGGAHVTGGDLAGLVVDLPLAAAGKGLAKTLGGGKVAQGIGGIATGVAAPIAAAKATDIDTGDNKYDDDDDDDEDDDEDDITLAHQPSPVMPDDDEDDEDDDSDNSVTVHEELARIIKLSR
jgi:hypothetical protein